MTAHVQENHTSCQTMQQATQIICVDAEPQSLQKTLEKHLDTPSHQETDNRCYFFMHHGGKGLA